MINFVSGMWSGLPEVCQNFTRQAGWRTLAPLMVTASLMNTFREVGWASLFKYCPKERTRFLSALEAVEEKRADIVYSRPDSIARARYKTLAKAAISLGQIAFPTLRLLQGTFRSASLSADVRYWIRDNKSRITAEVPQAAAEDFLEKVGTLMQQIGAVGGVQ